MSGPLFPKFPHMLHGGDYNPEQWREVPGIWSEDLRLMKLAHVNTVTLGVFSWAELEPEEGRFDFSWLDEVIDGLAKAGVQFILATPSGAKPNWLALKHEEVRKCDPQGRREPQFQRHNFCWSSPVYKERVRIINAKLAERYGRHPNLLLWHISNELAGSSVQGRCYCPLCFQAFRRWLQDRYGTVEKMNAAFWAKFWSHTYRSFDEVTFIDDTVHGLDLAWKRFTTDQIAAHVRHEVATLRPFSDVPVTTNLMGFFPGFDPWVVAKEIDVVSWDSYPQWHGDRDDADLAPDVAFTNDLYRPMKKDRPFLLMESTPSSVNWRRVSGLKRPGMHQVSSLQAIAHGCDSVLYFQFRKGRGSSEKFHGAVVDHVGHEHTRVFRDVTQVGQDLEALDPVVGASTQAEVGILLDWDSLWAIPQAQLMRNEAKDYMPTAFAHYRPFWRRGVAADAIDSTQPFDGYKILVAPMLYLLKPGVAERITEFVRNGGTFVATYLTGWVDQDDLCFLGGFPGPLREVLGIWVEETDALDDKQQRTVLPTAVNPLGLPAKSFARHFCDIVHLRGAEAVATYGDDFYAGTPAVTMNRFGRGRAYYVASRNDDAFLDAMIATLVRDAKPARALQADPPAGVSAQVRCQGERRFVFLLNFHNETRAVQLDAGTFRDLLSDRTHQGRLELPPYGSAVLERVAG